MVIWDLMLRNFLFLRARSKFLYKYFSCFIIQYIWRFRNWLKNLVGGWVDGWRRRIENKATSAFKQVEIEVKAEFVKIIIILNWFLNHWTHSLDIIWTQNFLGPKTFLDLKFLDQKFCWAQNIFGLKIFLDPPFFWNSKFFLDSKIILTKKVLDPQFLDQTFFGPKIFLDLK